MKEDKKILKLDGIIVGIGSEAEMVEEAKNFDGDYEIVDSVAVGDSVYLKEQIVSVVECKKTGLKMVHIDPDVLRIGDLVLLKQLGVTISSPETKENISIQSEVPTDCRQGVLIEALVDWFEGNSVDEIQFFSVGTSPGGFLGSKIYGKGFNGTFIYTGIK